MADCESICPKNESGNAFTKTMTDDFVKSINNQSFKESNAIFLCKTIILKKQFFKKSQTRRKYKKLQNLVE